MIKSLYSQLLAVALTVSLPLTVLTIISSSPVEAKTPGKTYCFRGYCHRVLTIAETQALVGKQAVLSTSNYDDCSRDRFNPCGLTSSGAVFQANKADNAASPIYPDGTIILVRHPSTKKTAVLRVNSAGPYHQNRRLDVSRATAEVLGFKRQGVANLEVRILQAPTKAEAGYRARRVYSTVPGYLGTFASLDNASVRYAAITAPNPMGVASLYPQASSQPLLQPTQQSIMGQAPPAMSAKVATAAAKRAAAKSSKDEARVGQKAKRAGV